MPHRLLDSAARHLLPHLVRPLHGAGDVHLVTVGGATFGGSGKTPLAILVAAENAARGGRVALVGHAYRARPGRPRVVTADDTVHEVGDEALVAFGELARRGTPGVEVIVAPRRQAAVDLAVRRGASLVVVDGPLQTAPRRADRALLAVDEDPPSSWFPSLPRAPAAVLRRLVDERVPVRRRPPQRAHLQAGAPWWQAPSVELCWLFTHRVGLATAEARPQRLTTLLTQGGFTPCCVIHGGDHRLPSRDRLDRAARAHRIDVWLVTGKGAAHAEPWRTGPTLYVLEDLAEAPTLDRSPSARIL